MNSCGSLKARVQKLTRLELSATVSRVSLIFLVSLCAAHGGAFAQERQAASRTENAAAGLEEITVTAERREASVQAVPIAVTALDAAALANTQIATTQDLQRIVPSLRLTQNVTSPTNLQPAMRGSVEQNGGQIPTESPIGVYVDDVYINSLIANNTTLSDIERVEVLRGPQGTLYGRNTFAGAIKFVTRTPGDTSWLNADVGYGNYNQYRVGASAGGRLSSAFAASLAAQVTGEDGYFHNNATKASIGKDRNYAVRGKLRYTAAENFDAIATVSYSKDSNDGTIEPPGRVLTPANQRFHYNDIVLTAGGKYSVNIPPLASAFDPIKSLPSGETEQFISSINLSYKVGALTLRSISAYVDTKDYFTDDLSGAGSFFLGSAVKLHQFTQEFQGQGEAIDSRLRYILGLYFLRSTGSQHFGWDIGIPISETFTSIGTTSYAAYGQVDFDLTDALTVTAGLRGLEDKKTFSLSLHGFIVPSDGPVALRNTYSAATPHLGVSYKLASAGVLDEALVYATASRGFKPGGYNNGVVVNANDARSPYGPETGWNFEGGFKSELLERRLRINASVFVQRIDGLQLTTTVVLPNGGLSFPVQNSGRAEIKGLELDTTAAPIKNLQIYANASFMNGKYLSFAPASAVATAVATYGNATPPQVPHYTFTIGGNYDIPLSFNGGAAHLSVGGDWYRSGKYLTDATSQSIVDPYSRVNAYVAVVPSDHWEVRFTVKNILNNSQIVSGTPALGAYIVLPPREFFASLRYRM